MNINVKKLFADLRSLYTDIDSNTIKIIAYILTIENVVVIIVGYTIKILVIIDKILPNLYYVILEIEASINRLIKPKYGASFINL